MHTARMFRNLLLGMLVTQGISTNIGLADAYYDGPMATLDLAGKPIQRRIAPLPDLPPYSPPPAAAMDGGLDRSLSATVDHQTVPAIIGSTTSYAETSVHTRTDTDPRAGRTLVIEEETNPGLIGRLRGRRITRIYQEMPEPSAPVATRAVHSSISTMRPPVQQAAQRPNSPSTLASEANRRPSGPSAAQAHAPVTEDEVIYARRKAEADRLRQEREAKRLASQAPGKSPKVRKPTKPGLAAVDPEIRTIGHDELLAVAPIAGESGIEVQRIIERIYEENENGEPVLIREIHYEAR